ncbi:MAG: sulfite exporter TauE/SafE family protein [Endozoicomonas sp.]
MDLTNLEMLAALSAVFAGALVQGTIGFGLAVVAAPVLFVIEPELVPGSLITMAMLTGLLTALRYLGSLQVADLKYAVLGRVPGSIVGAGLLAVASAQAMSLFLGICVLLAVAASLSQYKLQATPKTLMSAGFLSGVMGTTSGIGGPPMALVMQNQSGDKIRAQLSAYFVISCLVSLVILRVSGQLDWWHVKNAAFMVPAVLAGLWVAGRIAHRINQVLMRRALLVICSVAGTSAIVNAML